MSCIQNRPNSSSTSSVHSTRLKTHENQLFVINIYLVQQQVGILQELKKCKYFIESVHEPILVSNSKLRFRWFELVCSIVYTLKKKGFK